MATFRVGLTGGLAGGKSTVAEHLRRAGLTVADADALIAESYRAGGEGAAIVEGLFGAEALDAEGAVDRKALAAKVFTDPQARARLEAEIHPLVRRLFDAVAEQAEDGIAVLEATLLVDTGQADRFDFLVTVEAYEAVRLERAVARGLSADEAAARLAAQVSSDQRRREAAWVVENDADLEALAEQARVLADEIRRRAAAGATAETKTVAVLGASTNRGKFGNKSLRAHRQAGWLVYPVNPRADRIEGIEAFADLDAVPARLDRITVYLPPPVTLSMVPSLARRDAEIWLNPGAGSPELSAALRAAGAKVVEACSIVDLGLRPSQFP